MLNMVSVIIPVYNCESFIGEAIQSVLCQTYRDFELIVVNDGSSDHTEDCLKKYSGRINYVKQDNKGLAAARARGLELARGSLIAFLDADDVWLPRKLERQVDAFLTYPECGIVTADTLSFSGEAVVVRSLKERYKPESGDVLEHLLFDNWIPPSAAMVRRECFESVKTFDVPPPSHGEDWLMWLQIAAHYRVHFIDEVLVRRRLHSNNMSSKGEDTQFQCLLRNFELIRNLVPRLNGRPNLVNEAAFRVCLRRGIRDITALRLPQARQKLRRALAYKPLAIRAWLSLAAAHSPSWFLGCLKQISARTKKPHARNNIELGTA